MRKLLFTLLMVLLVLSGCGKKQVEETPTPTADADTTAPFITVKTYSIETTVGNAVNLLDGVSAYDSVDGSLTVTVEGKVDWDTPGEYYPSYVATDLSGNKASSPITVVVKDDPNATPTPSATPATTSKPVATSQPAATANTSSNTNTNTNTSTSQSTATPSPTASVAPSTACSAAGAKDSSIGCGELVDWEVNQYDTLYQGESGWDACNATKSAKESSCANAGGCYEESRGYFVNGECAEITTNDWTFWGVGLKYNYNPN